MASAIASAELRVRTSRRELHQALHHLRCRLSEPSTLGSIAATAALLGFVLTRNGRMGAVIGTLATGALRYTLRRLP